MDNLHHAVALAAALGALSLGSCTEKPDSHVLKANLAAEEPDLPQLRPAAPHPSAVPARPQIHVQKPSRKGPRFDPGTLVGLEPTAVDRVLGRPAGTRTDATTVEWTYSGPNCSLSIFFYPDIATGTLKALKYNVTNKGITNRQAGFRSGCVDFPMMARSDESG